MLGALALTMVVIISLTRRIKPKWVIFLIQGLGPCLETEVMRF